jgi:hypothetical protein
LRCDVPEAVITLVQGTAGQRHSCSFLSVYQSQGGQLGALISERLLPCRLGYGNQALCLIGKREPRVRHADQEHPLFGRLRNTGQAQAFPCLLTHVLHSLHNPLTQYATIGRTRGF